MRRPEWVVLAAGAALLFPLQWRLDAHPHEPTSVVHTVELLAPLGRRGVLPVLAVGQGGLAADLLEIQATSFLLRDLDVMQRLDAGQLRLLYSGIMELDPYDPGPVERGAVLLSAVADRPDLAKELLEEGIDRVPPEHRRRWRLYWELAATHLVNLANRPGAEREAEIRHAGALLLELAPLPGVPDSGAFEEFGRRLFRRGGSLDPVDVLRQEEALWVERVEGAEEAVVRRHAERRLLEVRSAIRREELQRAVEAYAAARGAPPDDLELLGLDTTDPLGAGYLLREGRVVAPGVEAAALQRELVQRRAAWEREHPGGALTLEDLGVTPGTLPGYLEVELGPDEVEVRAAP